ncbi:MAG: hypothetical protein RLZZ590_241 [Actinomycetota bacterium]|jgi:AcrR family transcriptional regulator
MSKVRGRPRVSGESKTGVDTESEILRAAASLFCTVGYTATSTRLIADTAGLRQASIYHYFKAKQDILLALLLQTVTPSLDAANRLANGVQSPSAKLWALCFFDSTLLSSGPDNLGALYLLPETNDAKLEDFNKRRRELQYTYVRLVAQVLEKSEADSTSQASMVMALVESVILIRRDQTVINLDDLALEISDSALKILGLTKDEIELAKKDAETFR